MRNDFRHAVHGFVATPGSTLVVIAILAAGIGLNTATLAFVDATVLNPLPYAEADELVELHRGVRQRWHGHFSTADLATVRTAQDFLHPVEAYRERHVNIGGDGSAASVLAAEITPGLLPMLGVVPQIGRTIDPGDEGVVVVADGLWRRRFGADPNVVGKTLRVEGFERVIVGVLPRGVDFYQGQQLWLPLPTESLDAAEVAQQGGLVLIGRLKDGTSPEQARARLPALEETLAPAVPSSTDPPPLALWRPEETWNSFGLGLIALLLQGAAGLLLCVVLANVSGVMLVRGLAQQEGIGVRLALGAGAGRIVRLLLTECAALLLIAGTIGTIAAPWLYRALIGALPETPLVAGLERGPDLRVLLVMVGLEALMVIAVGMLPAREMTRMDISRSLHGWAAGTTSSEAVRRWQSRLTVAQVALAILLLVGVGLTARSLLGIRDIDPGFDARAVTRVWFSAPSGASDEEIGTFRHQFAEALRERPEIDLVALEGRLPTELFQGRGQPFETREGPAELAFYNLGSPVTHEYFDVMGLSLLRGRGFTQSEGETDANVALISAEAARRLWPDESRVLGRELRFPGSDRWLTVVGVVSDVVRVATRRPGERTGNRLAAEPWPDIYLPTAESEPTRSNTLLVRPVTAEVDLTRVLEETVRSVNPDIPVDHRTLWETSYEARASVFAVLNRLLALFGASILVVSALGIYGVLAHVSTLRTREYGIRLALGATRGDLLGSVLWHGQRLALIGIAVGATASYVVYRLAGNFLFGVGPDDPTTYALVGFTILVVAAAGALGPARRATATDPVDALRAQ